MSFLKRMNKKKIAVLLNENAKNFTPKLKLLIAQYIPDSSVYVSRTEEEAKGHIEEIVQKRYDSIFSGGGDGSFVSLINMLQDAIEEQNKRIEFYAPTERKLIAPYEFPDVGILKLGTGNAVNAMLGGKDYSKSLFEVTRNPTYQTKQIDLIESGDKTFPFSGLGWDAQLLNDYYWFKNRPTSPAMKKVMKSLLGYFAALFLKSGPTVLLQKKPEVRITNKGSHVFKIDENRKMKRLEVGQDEVIYEGPISIAAVGTTPFYGFNFKVFPYANYQRGLMNLRVVNAPLHEILTHLPSCWRGEFQSDNFSDYLVENIQLEFNRPIPLQIGGDPEGYTDNIHYSVSKHPISLIDFSHC
jgi:diacylglycerol kinase family enzyme